MPSADTFSIKPIGDFVRRYLDASILSVDPFSRNGDYASETNDLNPETTAQYHMDAVDFLKSRTRMFDLGILDPPYSPRQISECYKNVGQKVTTETTQSSFYSKIRNAMDPLIAYNGVVLSFGWNTVGMGKNRGYEIIEILLVCHGGAHNDTICMAERKTRYDL